MTSSAREARAKSPEKARQRGRDYRLRNPEKTRAYRQKLMLRDPEKVRASGRKFREENREKVRAYAREYQRVNRHRYAERVRAYMVEYHYNKPWVNRACASRRRASVISRVPLWADLAAIKEFYRNCPRDMVVDHIIPLRGKTVSGLHVLNNLQYLSDHDNAVKYNKLPEELHA